MKSATRFLITPKIVLDFCFILDFTIIIFILFSWINQLLEGMLRKKFLGHQFKSGHFQCKTQIKQNNCVSAPCKGPNPHSPYIVASVPRGQKIDFWFLSQTISCDHSLESLCCTDFKNYYLIYAPWKLLQHFKCWAKKDSNQIKP